MNKIVLCGMCGSSQEDLNHLVEIIEPIKENIEKIVWTINYKNLSDILNLDFSAKLGSLKEKYNIYFVYNQWMYRNDYARNSYLYSGHLKNGDICINLDTLERLKPSFFSNFDNLINLMTKNNIDGFFIHNKRFIFIYNDYLEYRGNPHEGIFGLQNPVELTSINEYKNLDEYFENVRLKFREKYYFVDAYTRYYYSYPNSNHCWLGYENNMEFIKKRENLRRVFRIYCSNELGLDFEVESLKNYILNNELDTFMKNAFSQERILNDFYRYHKLNDRSFEDRNTWDLISI